jgi:hypothetical protein
MSVTSLGITVEVAQAKKLETGLTARPGSKQQGNAPAASTAAVI